MTKDAGQKIAEVFEDLVRRKKQSGMDDFTDAERTIWFIISTRAEKDINSFESIFEQLHSKDDLKELSKHLASADLQDLSLKFQEIVNALEKEDFYDSDGEPITLISKLNANIQDKVKELEDEVGESLWNVDEKLLRLLKSNS